jgi:hypothetical protein
MDAMDELNGFDDIDWSKYKSSYWNASILPEMIKKLLTSDKDVFSDTMKGVHATFCHQGTIYEGTVKSVPLFWKVL